MTTRFWHLGTAIENTIRDLLVGYTLDTPNAAFLWLVNLDGAEAEVSVRFRDPEAAHQAMPESDEPAPPSLMVVPIAGAGDGSWSINDAEYPPLAPRFLHRAEAGAQDEADERVMAFGLEQVLPALGALNGTTKKLQEAVNGGGTHSPLSKRRAQEAAEAERQFISRLRAFVSLCVAEIDEATP